MSLYDRIFRPRRYTLSDGTVVEEKRSRAPLVILILVLLTAVSVRITGFNFSVLVKKGSKFFDILKAMFPPNTAYLGKIWQPLWDTIKMSFLGSFIGAVLAIPFAIAAASNIVTNRVVVFLVRLFLSLVRTLPTLVCALIATYIFGLGTMAGTCAIAVFTFAYVGKQLFEIIETVDTLRMTNWRRTMKISVIDGYTENPGDLSWDGLRALGDVVIYDHSTKDEAEIIHRVGDAEIVVANKSPISRRVLDACPNVKYITVQATGYDPINYVYAREKGIPVSNVPTYGTASVAQFAIALLLEICGHAAHHSDAVHAGRWAECGEWTFWDYPMIELAGKTMGIIGFGRIGQNVGRIAKALGMNVIAFNRSRSAEGAEIAEYVELDELLCRADVVSLHCPLFPETRGIINRETISKMKDGVIIINNSRGPLVVEQDLADALNSGKVYAAGLDVVSSEPISADNPLLKAKNCLITPHISWAPRESRQRIMDCTIENIRAFQAGTPKNVIN